MENKKGGIFSRTMTVVLAVMLMAITAITFYQIVMRYVFNMAPSWSEELVRFLFVWISFLGAGMGVKDKIHIGVDVLVNALPDSLKRCADAVVNLILTLFGVFITYTGVNITKFTHAQASPAIGIPMSYVYLSLPALGILLIIYGVDGLLRAFGKRKEGEAC